MNKKQLNHHQSQQVLQLPQIKGAQPVNHQSQHIVEEDPMHIQTGLSSARQLASRDLQQNSNNNESASGQFNANSSAVGSNNAPYKSILSMMQSKSTKQVGLNPNMKPSTTQSYSKIFPMYGLWREDSIFKTTKQESGTVPGTLLRDETDKVDKSHFKQKYQQKEFMEEMLKAKNMMGKMKR
eukprot:403340500